MEISKNLLENYNNKKFKETWRGINNKNYTKNGGKTGEMWKKFKNKK